MYFLDIVMVVNLLLRHCAELPLEPSLSRTLIEANESGCLSQALTIVAMFSAETSLLPSYRLVTLVYVTVFHLTCGKQTISCG